ncbi:MAG: hypothetical protein WDO19_02990 [Bacteroidota bacterium]
MKALVISGGGSKGAFAGGLAEYLITVCNRNYKYSSAVPPAVCWYPCFPLGK